jgi:hypothetical protein
MDAQPAGHSRPLHLSVAIATAVFLVAAIAVLLLGSKTARGALAPGLCAANAQRGAVPAQFAVDACFDGTTLTIRNNLDLALTVDVTGDVGGPQRSTRNYELPALVMRAASNDPRLLLPGDTLRFPVGGGAVTAQVRGADKASYYAVATVLDTFLPLPKTGGAVQAALALVKEVDDDLHHFSDCKASAKNTLARVKCAALLDRDLAVAVNRAIVKGGMGFLKGVAAKVLRSLGADVAFGKWLDAQITQIATKLKGAPPIIIAPAAGAGPAGGGPGASAPSSESGPPSGAGGPSGGALSGAGSSNPPPAPPPTWREQETPNHPVNTFTNYHNASGMGPPIAAGQWVDVYCKAYDPTIVSVNPDGYWYRIASSPWNGNYYSPANTFMNGDPYGGPYTHNTDFAVPNC